MSKKKIKKRLFDLEALEVSFVPAGINGRKFLVTKSDKGEQMDEILKELLEGELKDEAAIDEKIASMLPEEIKKEEGEVAKIQGTVKAAVKLLKGLAKRLPENERDKLLGKISDLAGLSKVKKEGDPKPEVKEPNKADPKEPVKKEGKLDPKIEEKIESILKSNEKLEGENKVLKDEIKKERDLRVTKEYEDKAAKEFANVGGAKEVGAVLKSAKDNMSDDEYKNFEKVMKANQTKLEVGNIFSELGSSQGASNDLETKIQVKKEAIMKANTDFTKEQAEAKAFEDNPELYNQYLDENPAQGGR